MVTQAGGFVGGPAVCNGFNAQGTWLAVGRASNNKFRWSIAERLQPQTAWADLGFTTFSSKPACAPLDELWQGNPYNYEKALFGKHATNGRYYVRIMKVPPGLPDPITNNPLPTVPSTVLSWTSISTETWTSAPAATVAGDALVVCGRRTVAGVDAVWCKSNPLAPAQADPFNNANWAAAIKAPALPSPWTAQGDPAVANTYPWLGGVTVAVRATRVNPAQTRIYFTVWTGSQFNAWTQFPTGAIGVAADDPAMDVDVLTFAGATLAFRGTDSKLYEGTGLGTVGWTFAAIAAAGNTNTGWTGSPALAGSLNGVEGGHVVLGTKSSQFYVAGPCPDPMSCN
jgi:hypothetical protein